jgi:hypothetical protein
MAACLRSPFEPAALMLFVEPISLLFDYATYGTKLFVFDA